jgi:nicotinate-nucleotide adenylyltransferase
MAKSENDPEMRIGLFGGSFNPIHNGHLRCLQESAEVFGFEQIHLIPNAIPPHKKRDELADARHRLAMTRLAIRGMKNWIVTDLELARKGPSYTVDTVAHYERLKTAGQRHYLIIGLDSLLEIHTWKSFRRIFDQIPIVVMFRPDIKTSRKITNLETIERYLRKHIDDRYTPISGQNAFGHPRRETVHYIGVQPQAISATEIRSRIRRGLTVAGLVPAAVADYIQTQGLYQ